MRVVEEEDAASLDAPAAGPRSTISASVGSTPTTWTSGSTP